MQTLVQSPFEEVNQRRRERERERFAEWTGSGHVAATEIERERKGSEGVERESDGGRRENK